jgi:hypothetical protein
MTRHLRTRQRNWSRRSVQYVPKALNIVVIAHGGTDIIKLVFEHHDNKKHGKDATIRILILPPHLVCLEFNLVFVCGV